LTTTTTTTSCLATGPKKLFQQRARDLPSLSYSYYICILILVCGM
jgi:hypothetical protein